jgi:thiol:disulfide interchange protein DsbD
VLPPGQVKYDENFQKNVETYHGPLEIRLPVAQAPAAGFTLDVVSQGCADAGLCYPPLTRQVRVSLTALEATATWPRSARRDPMQMPPAARRRPRVSWRPAAASARSGRGAGRTCRR